MIQFQHEKGLTRTADAQSLALTDGVAGQPGMFAITATGAIDNGTGAHGVRGPILEEATIVVVCNEAEIHGIMFAGNG